MDCNRAVVRRPRSSLKQQSAQHDGGLAAVW
jgi:hypothetical protein